MELRQLETFARLTAVGSFTRTAEELALTQPAVTRQIAALERELKTRLLERLGRRVELTAAGAALHPYALEILRLAEEAQRAVADVAAGVAGRLAVGASGTAATYVLPPLLRRYREAYPGVDLSVRTARSPEVAQMVSANAVDVGVVMDFRGQHGLREVRLAEYAVVLAVYPEHPLARRVGDGEGTEAGVHPSDLADQPLILMQEGTSLRAYADRLLRSAGVEGRVSIELDSVEAMKKMVEARLGIALLPRLAVEAEVGAGRMVALPLASPPERRHLSLIVRHDKYLSAALRTFTDLLRSSLRESG